ncbi:MAG: lipopolysaccharide heptosyltransferase I [Acidobacteria bacterium]|nr:lipopolysaccharide heptosyltransferase I [Acidobacteriota bacterium]
MGSSNFLIVRLSAIGDVVHTLPALMDLRASYPESEIDWLVESASAPLLTNSDAVSQVIEISTKDWRRAPLATQTWREIYRTIQRLRNRHYDVALDFQGLWKSAFLAWVSGATEVLGIGTADLRESSTHILYHRQAKPAGKVHRIERNRLLLTLLGVTPSGPARYPSRLWSPSDQSRVDSLLRTIPANFVVVNPGGGWQTKLWPAERFGKLARWINEKYGYAIVCTWGPGEGRFVEILQDHASPVPIFPLTLSITEFACLVRYAHMFIGGDTGPMHIAAAYSVPVLAIFGPTTVESNGPYQTPHQVAQRLLSCSHCYRRTCWHHSCMKYLELEEVGGAFQRFEQSLSTHAECQVPNVE